MKKILNERQKRRRNATLYPVYKMFSWDLLFFYSIEFLFYTITKQVTVSEVLIINGIYRFSRIIMQVPAVTITDILGKKKSIILGNTLLIFFMLVLIFLPGATGIIIAYFIFSLGYDIKIISESNLLYDSVSTKGGEGLYSKLDSRGGFWYYILDGIASLTAGYLFVINNYLPMIICLGFIVISTIISFGFQDIYKVKKSKNKGLKNNIKENKKELKHTFKFILKSRRMKSFILFQMVFFSLITIVEIYRSELLINIGIPEEQFSMIFAVLTLIGGVAISLRVSIEKKFKNRTLAFVSLLYIFSCLVIGGISSICTDITIMPIILIMYAIQKMSTAIWYILEFKYLKNFTNEKMRSKITFFYEFIGGISAGICSILAGLLLNVVNVQNAFLIIGLVALACMILTLDYMRTRFGLKPEEYKKEDIEFE